MEYNTTMLSLEVPIEIEHHLSLLYNTAKLLNSSLDIEEVLNTVIDMVIEVLGAERGFIMLFDKAEEKLKITVARNMEKVDITERDYTISTTAANRVFQSGRYILSMNAQIDPDLQSKSVLLHEIRSILCVPMKVKEQIIGVIYIDNRIRTGRFEEQQAELLMALAGQSATAIENARLYKQVSDDYKKIQELERDKTEFTSLISHELRTPLVPIKGYVETLKHYEEHLSREEKHEILDTMEGQVEHVSRLVNDLLTVASIETEGKMHLVKTKVDIIKVLTENIASLEKKYPLHKFKLELPAIPEFMGDRDKLSHAFYHIIDNGAKFSSEEGEITVSGKYNEKGALKISVKDNGIGLEEDHIGKIFNKFYQVDSSFTRSFEGMGIGLYIAKCVIDAHGGNIVVESLPGEGSTFYVSIPFQKSVRTFKAVIYEPEQ